jgi:8-oxo-dGTP pyrophosphatase MutT (NUDIX family)
MLSEKVNVSIFGCLAEGFYSGYASCDKAKNKKAYIISRTPVKDCFTGVVIAVAQFDDNDEKLIVAPENQTFYEPEIRMMLDNLRNVQLVSIKCLYEKSCGAIIFYNGKQNTKILLVKNTNGRYWSFPKGHIEKGETEKQTGLDVDIVGNFREVSDYCPFGKIRKHVVFFLAQAFTDEVKMQEEEISEYIWVDLQQARKICSYDNDLRIIDKAETSIKLIK